MARRGLCHGPSQALEFNLAIAKGRSIPTIAHPANGRYSRRYADNREENGIEVNVWDVDNDGAHVYTLCCSVEMTRSL